MDCICCDKSGATFAGPDGVYCNIECVRGELRRMLRNYGAFCEFYGPDATKTKRDALAAIVGETPPTGSARLDVSLVEQTPVYRSGL
jgi:hypothetical protein